MGGLATRDAFKTCHLSGGKESLLWSFDTAEVPVSTGRLTSASVFLSNRRTRERLPINNRRVLLSDLATRAWLRASRIRSHMWGSGDMGAFYQLSHIDRQ